MSVHFFPANSVEKAGGLAVSPPPLPKANAFIESISVAKITKSSHHALREQYHSSLSQAMAGTLTPVHFFSHGSTAMLGEQSDSADYWKECGDAARRNGIEHVVIMVHWH